MTQDLAIALILVAMTFVGTQAGIVLALIGQALLVVSTLLTVVSGVNYLVKNKAVLKDEEPQTAEKQDGEQEN